MRRFALFFMVMTLMACAPRGVITFLPGARDGVANVQPVYLVTNRSRALGAAGLPFEQGFGAARQAELGFARVDVSIPPGHRLGRIEWPGQARPDPARHFVTVAEVLHPGWEAFQRDLPPDRDVAVFVHGYNTNLAESVYRVAQGAHDYDAEVPVIAFSWPSAGHPRGYVYDRDSVMFARDGLEALLRDLVLRGDRRVLLLAHSMGSQLVMETLRQMSLSGQQQALRGVSGVMLISPDIDEDVFLRQAARIAPLPQPFAIAVSRRDRALGLSAWLTGRPSRLGSIEDPARLAGVPVDVIDLSEFQGGDPTGHFTAFTSPGAIRMLAAMGMAK